jgi:hypothetical protein
MMMMNSVSRLQKYSALAAAPCAALGGLAAVGGISVEATAGGVTTTVTANAGASWSNQAVFNAGGIDFNVFAFFQNTNNASMGLSINNADRNVLAGQIKFWSGGTQSKVISAGATGASLTNAGYGGSQVGNFNLLGTGVTGSNRYLGFFVQNTVTTDYVAGWINFDFDRSAGQRSFTINGYSVNVGANASVTMPASAGGGAVPGIGGLAGLAMGAAGMRRKRQRVA